MKTNIFYTYVFERKFKRYKRKFISLESDLKEFISNIASKSPDNLGGGIFKYRLSVKSKNRGKSGGLRIITFEAIILEKEKDITFLTIYDKSEQDSISKHEIEKILKEEGLI